MNLYVIVVNPHAKRLRQNARIKKKVHVLFGHLAHVIDADEPHHAIDELDSILTRGVTITSIFVVGGDGTFSNILNWIMTLPAETQPVLMSVGGGQFCYMTNFHGLPSKNPVKNLGLIFSGKLKLKKRLWEPLCVRDSLTGQTRYAAVVANGVISDVLQWYEDVGKGGILTVLRIILMAIASVAFDWLRRRIGRIHLLEGRLKFGSFGIRPKAFAGVAFSAIPELLSSCRPFQGQRHRYKFFCVAYWGTLGRLALAVPFVWFGRTPFWTKKTTFNEPVQYAEVQSTDPRLVLDGDLFLWPGSTKHSRFNRTLMVTTGEQIPILVVID